MLGWLFYILSVIFTYLIQRETLKRSEYPECYPTGLLIFLIFVPVFGLVISLVLLLLTLCENTDFWKKIYRL